MASEAQLRAIDRYLDREMNAVERTAFEQELAKDEELRQEFNLRQVAMQSLEKEKYQRLRNELMDRGQQHRQRPATNKYYPLLAAASVALLAIAAYFLMPSETTNLAAVSNTETSEASILDQLERPAISGKLSGEGEQAWFTAHRLYQKGKCKEATTALQKLIEDPLFKMSYKGQQARLMIGYCLIEQQQGAQAIEYLLSIPVNTAMDRESRWCLAFANLQAGKREEALRVFQRVAEDVQNRHRKSAIAIVDQLKGAARE